MCNLNVYLGQIHGKFIKLVMNTYNQRCNIAYVPFIDKFLLFKFTQDESFYTTFTIDDDLKIRADVNWNKIPYSINVYSTEHCVLLGYQYVVYILSWQTNIVFYDSRNRKWYQSKQSLDKTLRVSQMSWTTNTKEDLYYFASSVDNMNEYQFDKTNYVFDMNRYLPSPLKAVIINHHQNDHKVLVNGYCHNMQRQIQSQVLLYNIPLVINDLIDGYYMEKGFDDISSLGLQKQE